MSEIDSEEQILEEIHEGSKLSRLKAKLVDSETLKIGVAVFFLLTAILFAVPFAFNNSGLKFKLSQKISQIFEANFIINGDVEVALIPVPKIIINDVLLQNYKNKKIGANPHKIYNFYAKSIKLKLPLFKTSGDSFATKVIIKDPIIEIRDDSIKNPHNSSFSEIVKRISDSPAKSKNSNSGISSKIFTIDDLTSSDFELKNLPKIIIENGELDTYGKLGKKRVFKGIDADILIDKNRIEAEGSFASKDISTDFDLVAKFGSKKGDLKSSLKLSSSVFVLNVNGDFTSSDKTLLANEFSGKLEAEISEIKSFYGSYLGEGVFYQKLKKNPTPIKLSASINSEKEEIAVRDFLINSSLINGKGDIDFSFAYNIPLIDIILKLDNLDLDSLWSSESVKISNQEVIKSESQATEEPKNILPPIANPTPKVVIDKTNLTKSQIIDEKPEEKSSVSDAKDKINSLNFEAANKIKDFDLTAEIDIKTAKYLQGEIRDVNLYATFSKEGQILILPMIFKTPGKGNFRVNGVLDNSANTPKFIGKFDATGESLKDIFKWFKIEAQNLKFDNLKEYSVYSDIMLLPNKIALSNFYLNLENDKSEFLGEINIDSSGKVSEIISSFNASNFNIDDYFLTSGQNAYLSPGLLLKKLLWLNEISTNNDFNLNFERLLYKGEEFDNQSLNLKFGRGYFSISDLSLNSKKTNLKADLAVDISDKNPSFKLKAKADNFYYNSIPKNSLNPVKKSKKQYGFIDQIYALPSLEGFKGNISLDFENLDIDGLEMKNFKLSGRIKDGNIESAKLNADLYEGSLEFKGLLGIRVNKIINGNYSFNQVSLKPLLADLVGINNIDGVANIAANITSAANKKENFVKTVSSEIKFIANSPIIEGYGLGDLIKKMFAVSAYRKELQNPEKILFNRSAKTILKKAEGTIKIKDGQDGKIKINVVAPALNGILSGTVSVQKQSSNTLFNAIFLTGTRQKQTPINIATSIKINSSGISHSTNIDQVRQYLGLSKSDPIVKVKTFEKEIKEELQTEEKQETIEEQSSQIEAEDKKINQEFLSPDVQVEKLVPATF